MNRNSPVPLWAVLSVGVVLLGGIYVVAQHAAVQPQVSVVVRQPAFSTRPSESASATPAVALPAPAFRTTTTLPSSTQSEPTPATEPDVRTPTKDFSEIDLAVGTNATFLIEDQVGRRTGRNFSTNRVLQEIPHSAYFEDNTDNAVTGEPGKDVSHQLQLFQPLEGAYRLVLTGLQQGTYNLNVRVFSRNGGDEPVIEEKGYLTSGLQVTFLLEFTSAPGGISTLTRLSQ